MAAQVLDGKKIAQALRMKIRSEVQSLRSAGMVPGLAVVLVGEDPASHTYVRNKTKACEEVGIQTFDHRFPADVTTEKLLACIARMAVDTRVHGILVQLPLPKGVDTSSVLRAIPATKDVDGLLIENVGFLWQGSPVLVPCTPLGVMHLLEQAGVVLPSAHAVIVGRSQLVGRPMAALLLAEDVTVTMCHSKTKNLKDHVLQADILIAAMGKPREIKGSWIKPGAVVIDVGTTRLPDGRLCGDVEFELASERASIITPVPGGVGPMTIAMLLHNTVRATRLCAHRGMNDGH